MADKAQEANNMFLDLQKKLEKLNASYITCSPESLREFTRGFDLPVVGILEYLKENTSTHRAVECHACIDEVSNFIITDAQSYEEFSIGFNRHRPRKVEFKYLLTDSVYLIGDVSKICTVYFSHSHYEIVYEHGPNNEFRLRKTYMSHMEVEEIENLRDLIAKSIIVWVSEKIDSLLN